MYPKDDATAKLQDQHAYRQRLMGIESSFGYAPTSAALQPRLEKPFGVSDSTLWDGRDDQASTGASWRHLLAEGSQLAPAEQPGGHWFRHVRRTRARLIDWRVAPFWSARVSRNAPVKADRQRRAGRTITPPPKPVLTRTTHGGGAAGGPRRLFQASSDPHHERRGSSGRTASPPPKPVLTRTTHGGGAAGGPRRLLRSPF
jgi:hypothetical protein